MRLTQRNIEIGYNSAKIGKKVSVVGTWRPKISNFWTARWIWPKYTSWQSSWRMHFITAITWKYELPIIMTWHWHLPPFHTRFNVIWSKHLRTQQRAKEEIWQLFHTMITAKKHPNQLIFVQDMTVGKNFKADLFSKVWTAMSWPISMFLERLWIQYSNLFQNFQLCALYSGPYNNAIFSAVFKSGVATSIHRTSWMSNYDSDGKNI